MTDYNRGPTVNPTGGSDPRRIALAINSLAKGNVNNALEVTLHASATLTTITSPLLGIASSIEFMPLTDNADAAMRAGPLYPSSQGTGTAVIKHRNNAAVDQTFRLRVWS